jgi:hypothetical protein
MPTRTQPNGALRGTVARVGTNEFVFIAEIQRPDALAGDAVAIVSVL